MTKSRIQATELSINKLFDGDYAFIIPYYQRPYAWTTVEASELLDDLLASIGDGFEDIEELDPYFFGSIVLIKGDKPDSKIVDGQQRLTTFTILLATLRAYLPPESGGRRELTDYLYEEGKEFAGASPHYRLELREEDNLFFRTYIQNDGVTGQKLQSLIAEAKTDTDSQANIRNNALHYLERLGTLSEKQRDTLTKFLIRRCFLVVVWTPDDDSAYRIFSVLNDRGLPLSHADILKAETIGQIPEKGNLQKPYAKKWQSKEDELGREAFQDLFAHIRMIYRKQKLRGTILQEFRQYVLQNINNPHAFIDDVLLPYADVYDTIRKTCYESTKHASEVNRLFEWLNYFDNVDWLPPALLYFLNNQGKPDYIKRFFEDLERLASGLMILRANINKRIERYGRLLSSIEKKEDLYAPGSPLQLELAERRDIIARLDGNIYGERYAEYVLLRLDDCISEPDRGANYDLSKTTIEHVLPQEPHLSSTWKKWFPDQEIRDRYVHRLGNLVLLTGRKNRQASNYDFERKIREYFSTKMGVTSFRLTTTVLREREWTPKVIERLQAERIDALKKLWRLGDD